LVLWVTLGARVGKPQEREALGRRAEGHRRQSRVRYEVTSVVKRNSRVFRRLGRLRGGFEKVEVEFEDVLDQEHGLKLAETGCEQIEERARPSYPGLVFNLCIDEVEKGRQ
jgi:hypothetical protein